MEKVPYEWERKEGFFEGSIRGKCVYIFLDKYKVIIIQAQPPHNIDVVYF